MDKVYNSLMAMGQAKPAARAGSAKKGKVAQREDDFQKLLQNQQGETGNQSLHGSAEKAEAVAPENMQGKPSAEGEQKLQIPGSDEMENRMMLAAMAAAQMIVPMQNNAVAENVQTEAIVLDAAAVQPQQAVQTMQNDQSAENQLFGNLEFQQPQGNRLNGMEVEAEAEISQLQQAQGKVQSALTDENNAAEDVVEIRHGFEAENPVFREVNAIPVQVGEVKTVQGKAETSAAEQVLSTLETAVKEGHQFIELELEPRNLGKVHIEMLMQKDGTLQVLLRAEKPATQLMLDRDAAELQSALARNTRQEVQVETPQQQENAHLQYDEQQRQNGNQQQNNRQNEQSQNGESFLQQLRLGLVPDDMLAS